MKLDKNVILGTLSILVFGLLVWGASKTDELGSAPSGVAATVATTSTYAAITTTAVPIFATTTECSSRTISSTRALYLTFTGAAGLVPTIGGIGTFHATGTTVYDAGLYGCALVTAIVDTAGTAQVNVVGTR